MLLQIENYIVANTNSHSNKVKVDDDWIWDIANSIRWVKQKFKDFKIERFLFGEIYGNYFGAASEFILNLMEELGYDKVDNGNESSSSTSDSPHASPTKIARTYYGSQQQLNESNEAHKSKGNKDFPLSSSAKFLSQLSQTQANSLHSLRDDSNSNCSYSFIGGVNSLFEEEATNSNEQDFNDYDEHSQNPNNDNADNVLNEFIKKKP